MTLEFDCAAVSLYIVRFVCFRDKPWLGIQNLKHYLGTWDVTMDLNSGELGH